VEKPAFQKWFHSLPPDANYGGLPSKSAIAVSICICDAVRKMRSFVFEDYLTGRGGQVSGATMSKLRKILAKHGEDRHFLGEGVRTSRGNHQTLRTVLDLLAEQSDRVASDDDFLALVDDFEAFLVGKAREYFLLERIGFDYNPTHTAREVLSSILISAKARSKLGPVAQHLVGAKLQLRFPDLDISIHPTAAQDRQLGREGDFHINDMVFHVTVAPNESHFNKCDENQRAGRSAMLLVPDEILIGTRQLLAQHCKGPGTAAESIESFVGQNIGEIALFERARLRSELSRLLQIYNRNVQAVESDLSLQIEVPSALML